MTPPLTPQRRGLLRRVVSKIFGIEVKGWCSEFENKNAARGSQAPSLGTPGEGRGEGSISATKGSDRAANTPELALP